MIKIKYALATLNNLERKAYHQTTIRVVLYTLSLLIPCPHISGRHSPEKHNKIISYYL